MSENQTKTYQQGGEDTQDPVAGSALMDANTIIYFGHLVWTRIDTGYAVSSTYAAANPTNVRCWGKATASVDNTTTNTQGNSGAAGGASVPFNQGVFLCNNDATIVQGSLGMPVWLVSDVAGTNNGLATVGLASISSGTARPLVGYVTNPCIYPNVNPDALKIPVRIGRVPATGPIPGTAQQDYAVDSTTAYSAAFSAIPGYVHKINVSGATFAYTLPAITSKIDGMKIAIVNVGAGTTATVAAPTGSDAVGNATGSTGATAAGPTTGAVKVYVADNTLKQWLVGI